MAAAARDMSVNDELEAAYRGDDGGGESKAGRSIIPDATTEQGTKLQLIRRENARLVNTKSNNENEWRDLYLTMKSLYDYEKRRKWREKHQRMIRRKCATLVIKGLAKVGNYKSACSCFIFRDVDKDQYEQIFHFGLRYPEDLMAPGHVWVRGGSIEEDKSYDKHGDKRRVDKEKELDEFAKEKGLKRVGNNWEIDPNPDVQLERWRAGKEAARVPRRLPVERGAPADPREDIEHGLRLDNFYDENRLRNIKKEEAGPEAGGNRRKSRKRKRKKRRKTKRLRRKKRKTKRRRKKKRTRRKR